MNPYIKIKNWYFNKTSLPYWIVYFADCVICFLSGLFVFWLFFRLHSITDNIGTVCWTLLVFIFVNTIFFRLFHTYSGILRYSSFVDLQKVGYAMGGACLTVVAIHYPMNAAGLTEKIGLAHLGTRHILSMYIISTISLWTLRVLVKTAYDIAFAGRNTKRALIYGVKDGGIGLAKNLRNTKPAQFVVKGFITNEKDFENRYLLGQQVFLADENLAKVVRTKGIQAVLVSPLRNEEFRADQQLQDMLINAGVRIYMMPALQEWSEEAPQHLKEVSVEDLLPRDQITIDLDSVGALLHNKKVMITGSAGSIGSEMVRQIAEFKPSFMLLIDQAETPQHDIRMTMERQYPEVPVEAIVTTITKEKRMENLFREFRPDYVFHAAAYKHVPMMEDNPSESIQNNVFGTKVIADLSVKYGVKKFVMVSTDKAVNPTNVMGCSKRICEIYVQALDKKLKEQPTAEGDKPATQFVTTRFGNVLGSNGSVIPLFERQIKAGGPVTVTHPDIIRYFMLIPEACKLVLEAGTKGNGGEIFIFDMGKPVKIADLAKRMITLSGAKGVEIMFTGLRAGEKLYEEVLNDQEKTLPSFHEKIRIAEVREYDFASVSKDIDELIALSQQYDDMATVKKMKAIVPEYKSKNSIYERLDW